MRDFEIKKDTRGLKSLPLIALIYLIAQSFLYSATLKMPIKINNKTVIVSGKSRAGEALRALGYRLTSGDLVDRRGQVALNEGGEPSAIYLNGELTQADTPLNRNDKIRFISGKDITDTIKSRIVPIPFRTEIVGTGTFISLRRVGSNGKREEIYGEHSGKIISSKIIKYPEPTIVRRLKAPAVKKVALTFDDGPNPPYTEQITDILKERRAPATFFVLGRQVRKYPGILAATAADGFTIGSHSVNHVRLDRLDIHSIDLELDNSRQLIVQNTKTVPAWLRPPYGKLNDLVVTEAAKYNYKIALWNVDSLDWRAPDPEFIWQQLMAQIKPGAIILMHDGGGDRHSTVAVLPRLIRYLRDNGYEIVSLDKIYTN